MNKLIINLCHLRARFAPQQAARVSGRADAAPASGQRTAPARPIDPLLELAAAGPAAFCATAAVPLWSAEPVAPVPSPGPRRQTTNLRADARGNTTLELMTQWLRGER